MAGFTAWLLKEQYAVRLFIGDVSYDTRVIRDVIDALDRDRVPRDGGRLTAEPVRSVEQLLAELTATDMVVATRFHNVLLALLLGKPVLSVAYDPKIEALMAGVGLAAYSARVGDLAVDTLIDKFRRLEADGQSVRSHLPGRLEAHRLALDVQYGELTAMVRHASPAAAPRPSGPHTTAGLRTVPGEPGGAGRRASG
jgi:polysaccharide pyruvyl transferase WcaK-like protein